jgi:uncharacterized protein YndB with AHSA1/START domain
MSEPDLKLTAVPSVETGMLIRRPPAEVFEALVDPAVTTRFWFTKSSGRLVAGAHVRWDWEMYGASAEVFVKEIDDDERILIDWGQADELTTVEFRFIPYGSDATFVQVTESGLRGNGDALVARAAGATGGFTIMLCALKALLEHGVVLSAVGDRFPKDLEQR